MRERALAEEVMVRLVVDHAERICKQRSKQKGER